MRDRSSKLALRLLLILLASLIATTILLPPAQGTPVEQPEEVTILNSPASGEVERFGEILSLIEKNYFEEVELSSLVYRAIEGMVEGWGESAVRLQGDLAGLKISTAHHSTTLSIDPDPRNWHRYKEIFGKALTFLKIYPPEGYEDHTSELAQLAIDHMLEGLDAHSDYLTPEEFEEVESETKGEYGGVGIEITLRQGKPTVVSTFEGTPAHRAGIQSGDQIVAIDGEPTASMSLFDAVRRIRGKEGTSVVLSLTREGRAATLDYALRREVVRIVSVTHRLLGDDIGYIKIRAFNETTDEDLEEALRDLGNGDRAGIILDLRGNPGGLLEESIDVAGRFLEKGQLVVETWSRVPDQNMKFANRNREGSARLPMVVLLDRGSASASEIVASALQDYGRALIVGETTFGKGTVQTIIPLSEGSALRLTVAKYRSPLGREIDDVGVTPDVAVESSIGPRSPKHPAAALGGADTAQSADPGAKAPLEIRLEDRDDLELLTVPNETGRPSDDIVLALAKTILRRVEPQAMGEFISRPLHLRRLITKEEKYVSTTPRDDRTEPVAEPAAAGQ